MLLAGRGHSPCSSADLEIPADSCHERACKVTERGSEAYRGHAIIVEADEHRVGGWGWYYLVDGRISSMGRSREIPDAVAALRQGLKAARNRVDELENSAGRA